MPEKRKGQNSARSRSERALQVGEDDCFLFGVDRVRRPTAEKKAVAKALDLLKVIKVNSNGCKVQQDCSGLRPSLTQAACRVVFNLEFIDV